MVEFGRHTAAWPVNNKLKFQDAFAAPDTGYPGTYGFEYGGAIKCADEGFDFFLHTRELDGVDLVRDVDDAATKDVGHAFHLVAFLAHRPDLDQHQLALDMRTFGKVDHLDHIDQAIQVLGDLFDDFVRAISDDGHARQGRVFGRRHRQGFDVVAAGRKKAHDARQGTGFVFQEDRNHVFHFFVLSLQVFGTEQHFGQTAAGFHHRPDVFGLIGDEVHEDQTVLVFGECFADGGLDIRRLVDPHADVAIAFDQLDEVRQSVDIRLGIT